MAKVAIVVVLVLLVMTGLSGCNSPAPEADFEASSVTGNAPIEVRFTDLSTGEIDTWEWDFDNDGHVDSTLRSPGYTFTEADVYTVSLRVSGPDGSDVETKEDYVEFSPPLCNADFIADTTHGEGVTTVQFTDLSEGDITGWAWDFNGDGIIDSDEPNPAYTYRRDGIYSITLTVFALYGYEDTLIRKDYIEITGCPT